MKSRFHYSIDVDVNEEQAKMILNFLTNTLRTTMVKQNWSFDYEIRCMKELAGVTGKRFDSNVDKEQG